MEYQDLNLEQYVYHFLKNENYVYGFNEKNILFLHLGDNVDSAKFFLKFGAKHVWFANPSFNFQEIDYSEITKIGFNEINKIPDNSVDLVIGLEILEHILNLEEFNKEIIRITKPNAKIELNGRPLWTSPRGHHLWLPKYKFNEISNPFEPWEHLNYSDKSEMYNALISKGIDKKDSKEISDWVYNDEEINRFSLNFIINFFVPKAYTQNYVHDFRENSPVWVKEIKTDNFEYSIINYITNIKQNKFYEIAKNYYTEEELNTDSLIIKIIKNEN